MFLSISCLALIIFTFKCKGSSKFTVLSYLIRVSPTFSPAVYATKFISNKFIFLYSCMLSKISKQILNLSVTFWFKYSLGILYTFAHSLKSVIILLSGTFSVGGFLFCVCVWTLQIYFTSSKSSFRSPK